MNGMTNEEKMIERIHETISKLNPEYIRKVMIYSDTLYEIQLERSGK